jgi:anaerobic selenocysteine-containing dehydrogenase
MTNPLRSAANSRQLEAAFAGLDFIVAVDFYINETTRHAHIILPTASPAEQPNYEFGLYHLSVRNVAKWSWPVVTTSDAPPAWEVLLRLGAIFMGLDGKPLREIDDAVFRQLAASAIKQATWPGLAMEEVAAAVDGLRGPERVIDLLMRVGPYGDGFGRRPGGLTLERVREARHGLDLGPLQPRLREVLSTASGRVELAPPMLLSDLTRLRARLARPAEDMVLIGRRDLRASNSFMHNLPALVKGPDRCTLQVSPADAARLGLATGGAARVTSRVGSVVAPVEVTDDVMPGVVSLPHGWGHDDAESRLTVAKAHAGINANVLTDDRAYDELSGTAVLFGTPVTVEAAQVFCASMPPSTTTTAPLT